jgi:signal transduction histidine kinase
MQTGLDVVLSQPRTTSDYRATLENMHEEVLRLGQLTTHLLTLARADAHILTIEPRPVDFSLLLNTVADQVAVAAEQKQIAIQRDIPPSISIKADEDRLIQLALNLLENAVKYTPAGGSITIKLAASNGQVCFSVADTGVGISPQQLRHIFDRFYRVDRARSREQGGFGLGLAIAQQIAHLHGGEISVASQEGAGSVFMVTLPGS